MSFGEGLFLLLDVEGRPLVDLHRLGEHIHLLIGHLIGVVCAGLTAGTGILTTIPLIVVLFVSLHLPQGTLPLLGSGVFLEVVD